MNYEERGFSITTDIASMDIDAIHRFISRSYWATDIPLVTLRKAIDHSLCFGLLQHGQQLGFARVVTDYATFGYLADVYIVVEHRGQGLGLWLIQHVMSYPKLQGLRRMLLATADAHGLYEKFDFRALAKPENLMERWKPDIYRQPQ